MTTRDDAYAYMREHPGELIHYRDVAKAIDIEQNRVNSALNQMVREHPAFGVTRPETGYFKYTPAPNEPQEESVDGFGYGAGELYEAVGNIAGHTVVRDSKGRLHVLMKEVRWTFSGGTEGSTPIGPG